MQQIVSIPNTKLAKQIELPELIMFVGLPASGKSTYAKSMENYVWCSSDAIREEFPGCKNDFVFGTMYKRVANALTQGQNCIYDATNLSSKHRVSFLRTINRIACKKICILFLCSIPECKRRNMLREGIACVPEEVYNKFLCQFHPPVFQEGWDEIRIVYDDADQDIKPIDLTVTEGFDQHNPHHTFTLGEHLKAAEDYIVKEDPANSIVITAARYHDIGKIYTGQFCDVHGNKTDIMHFYGHEGYGSYLYLLHALSDFHTDEDMAKALYISALIAWHMRPLNAWEQSKSAKEKDRKFLGEKMFSDLCLLHEADLHAH